MTTRMLTCLFFLMPTALFAEANVPVENEMQTYLLKAPGTITGMNMHNDQPAEKPAPRFKSTLQTPLRYKSQRSGNRVESFKFPQYGQVHGRYNPWSEQESKRPLPPSLPPANPRYSNPWDLSGQLPPQNPQNYQALPPPEYWATTPDYGVFEQHQGMNPDFPDSIYRDTNPASTPFFNGMFPGVGGKDFDFPFSPFKMF